MTRGSYNLQNRPMDDTSWKSCTCALLIFATICGLILLLTWSWRHPSHDEVKHDHPDFEHIEGYDASHMDKSEKLMVTDATHIPPEEREREDVTWRIVHVHKSKTKNPTSTKTYDKTTTETDAVDHDDGNKTTGDATLKMITKSVSSTQIDDAVSYTTESAAIDHSDRGVLNDGTSTEKEKVFGDDVIENTSENNIKSITSETSVGEASDDFIKSYKTTTTENYDTSVGTDSTYSTESTIVKSHDDVLMSERTTKKDDVLMSERTTKKDDVLLSERTTKKNDVHDTTTNVETKTEASTPKIISDYDYDGSPVEVSIDDLMSRFSESTLPEKDESHVTEKIDSSKTTKTYLMYAGIPLTKATETVTETIVSDETDGICRSTACKVKTSEMLALMSHETDPCDDFYEYSCKGITQSYVAETDPEADVMKRIADGLKKINSKSRNYKKQYKRYYTSCVNYDPILDESTKAVFKEELYSEVTFYNTTFNEDKEIKIVCLLVAIILNRNFASLYDFQLDVNNESNTFGLAFLPTTYETILETSSGDKPRSEQCILKHQDRKSDVVDLKASYDEYKKCEQDIDEYIKTTRSALMYVDALSHTENQEKSIQEVLNRVTEIITYIKNLAPHPSELKRESEMRHFRRMTVNTLNEEVPFADWDLAISTLIDNTISDLEFQIYSLDKLKIFLNHTSSLPESRITYNAILAMYTQSMYREFILNVRNPPERHVQCLKSSMKLMPHVSAELYIESFTSQEIKTANELVEDVFARIQSSVDEYETLFTDVTDKSKIREQMNGITLYTLTSHTPWINKKFLDNEFLEVNLTDSFIHNTIKLQKRYRKTLFGRYKDSAMTPENMWTYLVHPFDTKIKLIADLKALVIPLGAIQTLIKDKDLQTYFLMSDLGFKIAKEIGLFLEKTLTVMDNTVSEEMNITDMANGQTVELQINSNMCTDLRSDYIGATIARNIYNSWNFTDLTKNYPVLWLEKPVDQLFYLNLGQQFCTKKPISESMISLYEDLILPPIVKLNTIAVKSNLSIFKCKPKIVMQGSITSS